MENRQKRQEQIYKVPTVNNLMTVIIRSILLQNKLKVEVRFEFGCKSLSVTFQQMSMPKPFLLCYLFIYLFYSGVLK